MATGSQWETCRHGFNVNTCGECRPELLAIAAPKCIANASNDPNSVRACDRPSTHIVREPRGATAAKILGRPYTEHAMCDDHSSEIVRAGGASWSRHELAIYPKGCRGCGAVVAFMFRDGLCAGCCNREGARS